MNQGTAIDIPVQENTQCHAGLCTDLQPTHSTTIPMSLTVVLAIRYVATPPPPAVRVRFELYNNNIIITHAVKLAFLL